MENRTGAGGSIATDLVAKAPPDGYTLLLCNMATHAIGPALHRKLPYDHLRDFAPISLVGTTPNILVVHPSMPVHTIGDFIALAKANPGKINYGSSGVGTALHLTMELFRTMSGIEVVHVPYKGGSTAGVDLMAGHIVLFNSEFRQLLHEARQRGPLTFIDCVRHRPVTTMQVFPGESPFHLTMVHDLYCILALMNRAEPSAKPRLAPPR